MQSVIETLRKLSSADTLTPQLRLEIVEAIEVLENDSIAILAGVRSLLDTQETMLNVVDDGDKEGVANAIVVLLVQLDRARKSIQDRITL